MRADTQQIKRALKTGKIEELFKEELGWNKLQEASPEIFYKGQVYAFKPLAQKAGFKIYQYVFPGRISEDRFLYQLHKGLNVYAAEHLTIFVDANRENQVWAWVKSEHEENKVRSKFRLRKFNTHQSGDLLAQKLESLFVSLDEEELITLTAVLSRVKQGFDVEKVTKTFYILFKEEHTKFLKHIENIPDDDDHKDDREWYASIMLNRLMFIYFIQKKGLLDNHSAVRLEGDKDYLRRRLHVTQQEHGPDNFYAFYRYFLRRLFHEGLSQPEPDHSSELKHIIGNVPYINGGLFDLHLLERRYPDIQIKDEAFEQVFAFFERFDWHLDDRSMRNDREINPDVLGYIFEKYINQKQMGAYYTKEDITEYISKNTIIPFIFEKVVQTHPDAFVANGPIWALLKDNPDEYSYDALAHGILEPLPSEIEAGITDITQRSIWNTPADEQFALPTETWREVVERRQRYEELQEKMLKGEICTINDLITYNLNITQFARDVISTCEEPGLLRAFYNTIKQITVLDPTCGSGAFLFAALNILKPLYQACIEHMRLLVAQYKMQRKESNSIHEFRQILDHVDQHHSQEYFILKAIIIDNLYGVDLMEEAIEICKLRLFLKLVAQIEKPQDLEPLPDIDFNVLAGNTLIGFTSLDEIRQVVTTKLVNIGDTEKTLQLIEHDAQEIERDEQSFRNMQTRQGIEIDSFSVSEYKQKLHKKLENLRGKLDPYLATEYAIYESKYSHRDGYEEAYTQWLKSHKPFHWWAEFYKIMQDGGFDVIIGNPPYVEYNQVKKEYNLKGYKTLSCNNLYPYVMERSLHLQASYGWLGMIVPVSMLCTDRMVPLQKVIFRDGLNWTSSFDMRPSSLFTGVSQRLSIHLRAAGFNSGHTYLGGYRRWHEGEREKLLQLTSYTGLSVNQSEFGYIPKVASPVETSITTKLSGQKIANFEISTSENPIYVHRIIRYFVKAVDFIPYFWNEKEGQKKSEDYKPFFLKYDVMHAIAAILNSSLFYWFWRTYSDGFHCGYRDVRAFRLGSFNTSGALPLLTSLGKELMVQLRESATKKVVFSKSTGRVEYDELNSRTCLSLIWKIDRVLAQHYGFTPEELDFIINYDIKYRMGRDNGEESEE